MVSHSLAPARELKILVSGRSHLLQTTAVAGGHRSLIFRSVNRILINLTSKFLTQFPYIERYESGWTLYHSPFQPRPKRGSIGNIFSVRVRGVVSALGE